MAPDESYSEFSRGSMIANQMGANYFKTLEKSELCPGQLAGDHCEVDPLGAGNLEGPRHRYN